jgi:hypothetical protein
VAISVASEQRIELLGTVELLHDHLITSLCQTVFQQTCTTERERQWRLEALVSFWTEVRLCAPQSLTQALQEAALGNGSGWPPVQASPEAFFQRCQRLNWHFFANLYEAFLLQVLPQAQPCYASPVHTLREYFPEVWIVDGSCLDAVTKRLKLLWDVRAQVLPGCLTAFYDLYCGIVRHLAFNADAAAGELPRAIAALEHVPEGTVLVRDRLYGVGAFFAALSERGLCGLCRRNGRQSWRWLRELSNGVGKWSTCFLTFAHIRVESRNGRRRKRRFCKSRKQWKSFTHIPGGKKLT